MIIKEKEVQLKDNSLCILRTPQNEDASKIIDFLIETARESIFLLRTPEEVCTSLERKKKWIEWMNRSDDELVLLAEIKGNLAGMIMIGRIGKGAKVKHRCSLSISVKDRYKRKGIGDFLLNSTFEFLKNSQYQFIELEVICRNYPAINFYLKNGFHIIGERPCALGYSNDTYDNSLIMYRKL